MYIVSFVDWLMKWLEAYPVPDKKAQTVSDLMSELFPRYGDPVHITTSPG